MSKMRKPSITIRPATPADTDFILSLVPRFVAFTLPKGRRKGSVLAAIRADLERALRDTPPGDHFFIAEDSNGQRAGFLHLQVQRDFFSGMRACHVSDLAAAPGHDGHGIGRALLEYAETWAQRNRCKLLTLSVFPGNTRAHALYERNGFSADLLRMAKPVGQGAAAQRRIPPQDAAGCHPPYSAQTRRAGVAKRIPPSGPQKAGCHSPYRDKT